MGRLYCPLSHTRTHTEIVNSSSHAYNLSVKEAADATDGELNLSLKIANVGSTAVRNPHVVVNDVRDWRTIESLLGEILEPGMDEAQKALAIWEFVVANRYHSSSVETGAEPHDPIKYLNVYGFGFCDDTASLLSTLWQEAGLETRIWNLNGHVVSEVKYDGAYHILDGDLAVFYSLPDGSLAGLSDIRQDFSLVASFDHHGLVDSRALAYDIYPGEAFLEGDDTHFILGSSMDMLLRPDESFEWRWDNIGKFHDNYLKVEPPAYANGKFTYAPDLSGDQFRNYLETEQDIDTTSQRGFPKVHLLPGSLDGHVVIKVSSPYVIVGAALRAEVVRQQAGDAINIYASDTPGQWELLGSPDQLGTFSLTQSLDEWLMPLSKTGKYQYYLMIEFQPAEAGSPIGINSLVLETDVQMSPFSLPALKPGENTVQYTDETSKEHWIIITHQWNQ